MSEGLKIEKGIPLPSKRGVPGALTTALRAMEVGDSVLYLCKSRNYSGALRSQDPRRFVTRSVEGGVRIWRIA